MPLRARTTRFTIVDQNYADSELKKAVQAFRYVCEAHGYNPGGFACALVGVFLKADRVNLEKLRIVFPAYYEALIAFRAAQKDAEEVKVKDG